MERKFLKIDREIFELENLNMNDRVILAFIQSFSKAEYGFCFMSNENIGKELNLSTSTIKRSIAKLKENNLIRVDSKLSRRSIFCLITSQTDPKEEQKRTFSQGQTDLCRGSNNDFDRVKNEFIKGQTDPYIKDSIKEEIKDSIKDIKKSKPKKEIDVYSSEIKFMTVPTIALQIFNYAFDTNYKTLNTATYETLQLFAKEDFAKVCRNASNDDFWKDKATPNNIFKLQNFEKLLNAKEQEKTTADLNIGWKGII